MKLLSCAAAKGKFLPVLLLALFSAKALPAQNRSNSIEVSPYYNVSMFSSEKNNLQGSAWGGDVIYHIDMHENKTDWVRLLHVQDVGMAFSYHNMQQVALTSNPSTKGFLGDAYGLTAKLSIALANAGNTQLLLTPGFGFVYSTESYFTNQSPLVGSHINLASEIGLKVVTSISKLTRIVAGVGVFHYSNGAYRLPNNGINALNISAGIVQNINQPGPIHPASAFSVYKHSFEFGADIGRRAVFKSKDGYYKSGIYAGYNYRVNPVFSLKAATDAVYYYKTFDINNFAQTYQGNGTSYDKVRVGLSLGGDLWIGRLALMANYGYYLHYKSYLPNKYYWTAGFKYYIATWVALSAKMYVNHTDADFAGFGLLFRVH
ncbi:acyloxyacyl hydrolase [Mucilaginibacter arboris]|uniref:Acyloxyacyl hydrolase n=1 Tax=Mucilaginibacter arboris TaxID=2682090 RepID=A0A7K1T1A5_9SPHI|nr:acyloxyacyl hydrolase [Mucilaginibacter arboris]MVN23335.1 hypothetical protein [Mucilaginibacter arboris]